MHKNGVFDQQWFSLITPYRSEDRPRWDLSISFGYDVDMSVRLITIFGGTGFLGRRIVARVLGADWHVRVAVRHPQSGLVFDYDDRVKQIKADIRDVGSVTKAVDGAAGVVNAVALYVEKRMDSFESVHVTGAENVARAAARFDVGLVHLSGIGVNPESPSSYVRARALGEQRTRDGCKHGVILRPSAMFGPGDAFLSGMTQMVQWLPLIPLFGDGSARVQPVHVDDVARAVLNALDRDEAAGEVFELGGPETLTYRDLLKALAVQLGRKRVLISVPFAVWNVVAMLMSALPNPPLTRDQLELMRRDNIARPRPGFAALGIDKNSLQRIGDNVAGGRT